jgi:hypothetical protein
MLASPLLQMLDRAEEVGERSRVTDNGSRALAGDYPQVHVMRFRASDCPSLHLDEYRFVALVALGHNGGVFAKSGGDTDCVQGTPSVKVTPTNAQQVVCGNQ